VRIGLLQSIEYYCVVFDNELIAFINRTGYKHCYSGSISGVHI